MTLVRNWNGLVVGPGGSAAINNSIFWANDRDDFAADAGVTLRYSIVVQTGGAREGEGVLHVDPKFVRLAPTTDPPNDDLHLLSTSRAMDSGDPTAEIRDEALPNGSRVDMGVYGNTPEATASPVGAHCMCPGVTYTNVGTLTQNETWTAACSPYYVSA